MNAALRMMLPPLLGQPTLLEARGPSHARRG